MREKTLSETKDKLDKYYWDSAPSYGMVQKWFTELRCGLTSIETIKSPDRRNKITPPEMINTIHDIVLNDPKVKVREIAEIVSTSTERVVNIFACIFVHEKALRKMSAAIPHNRPKTHSCDHFRTKFGIF